MTPQTATSVAGGAFPPGTRARTAIAFLLTGVGVLALAAGCLLAATMWLYSVPFAAPLISLGAFWINAGLRTEPELPPSWLTRLFAVVACAVLFMMWRFLIADPFIVTLQRQAYGYTPHPNEYGDDRVVAAILGAAAASITYCLGRRSR